jgi:putative ABC transport system permease protein
VVLEQSLYLSVLSFLPGLLVSLLLYYALAEWTGLLMILSPARALQVYALTALMCIGSGALAMRKLIRANPAELF